MGVSNGEGDRRDAAERLAGDQVGLAPVGADGDVADERDPMQHALLAFDVTRGELGVEDAA